MRHSLGDIETAETTHFLRATYIDPLDSPYCTFIWRHFVLNPPYSSPDTPALVAVSVPVAARSSFWRYPQPHALMSTPDFTAPAHFLPHRIRITNALVWLPSTSTADTNSYHDDNSKSNLFCQRKMSTSSTTAPLKSCKRPPLSTNLPLRSCAKAPRRRSGRALRPQVSWVRAGC